MTKVAAHSLVLPARPDGVAAHRWLYCAIRELILSGRLKPKMRLPSTRFLSQQYKLSRGTVVNAFDTLKEEGYIEGAIGSGTWVSSSVPDLLFRSPQGSRRLGRKQTEHQTETMSAYANRLTFFDSLESRRTLAFRANIPAIDMFPLEVWTKLGIRRLQRLSLAQLTGCPVFGYPPLREAIAGYLNAARGLRCTSDQIVIVSGTQEALDLTARLFIDPGDVVCLEDPGYPGAVQSFRAVGAELRLLPLDSEGVVASSASLLGAKILYTTPGHQFPLGMTMTLGRRLRILHSAAAAGCLIFEDDYDSEYRYNAPPHPALCGLDTSASVLLSGSFSKALFPSLRLGYLVIPDRFIDRFAEAKSLLNRYTHLLEQSILCDFMVQGHFDRHLRRMRQLYGARLGTLLDFAAREIGDRLSFSPVEAGLQTTGRLAEGYDAARIVRLAAERSVEVTPWFVRDGKSRVQYLQLGFAAINEAEIRRGVEQLAMAFELSPLS